MLTDLTVTKQYETKTSKQKKKVKRKKAFFVLHVIVFLSQPKPVA